MQKMKYSGVEWIGEIPEDWGIVKVKQAFIRKNEKAQQENPVVLSLARSGVRVRDVSTNEGQVAESYYNYNPVSIGDLLLNPMDLYSGANCSISEVEGVISPAYVNLRNRNGYYSKFYDYYFKVQYWMMVLFAHGKGVSFDNRWTLNNETLMNFPVVSPDYDTQRRIADFLDDKCGKIDRYIEKQQKIIDKLKEYKQAVITEAVTKGLNPDVPMKDSGIEWIGMIPEHWDVPEIKYLVRIASGGTPERNHPEYWNGNIPWIKTGELQNDIITNAEEYITEEGLNNSSAQVFNINTILVAMYGQGKTRGMTALLKTPASTNQACAGLTVTNSNVQIEYLWQCLIGAYDAIRSEAAGSGQPNLSATLIGNFHIALPPIEEQGLIVEYIKDRTVEIKSTIHKAEKLLEKLTEYKKSLIYEAVTGKLEV
jgi:type I restriction enzyme S subunit